MENTAKKPMNRDDIMAGFRSLAASQGFYGRLIRNIEEASDKDRERFWTEMESRGFTDMVDVVLFIEC